jgi:hypothetical protein
VRDPAGKIVLRKGTVLDAAGAARLTVALAGEVHLLEMEPGELHEERAGARLAAAASGAGVRVQPAAGGQWGLVSDRRGLLRVDVGRLETVNALEGISVFTLYDGQVVDGGEHVGRAKVTPLVIAESLVAEADRRCGPDGLVEVRPFRPMAVGVVAPARLAGSARERFAAALAEKLAWFEAPLTRLEFVRPDGPAVGAALEACREGGAELLVAAGANVLDPLDPFFAALERLGARIARRGAPADPGSLLWVAYLEETPVVGVTSCGMFSRGTLFDLVLPRILAGERIESADLARLGHGGLLTREMAFRFPPYRKGIERGSVG